MSDQITDHQSERITTHFFRQVLPSYTEYVSIKKLEANGDDLRIAMAAAGLIYHFKELLPKPYNTKNGKSIVDRLCADYHVLNGAINAYKHHDVKNDNNLILSSDDIRLILVQTEFKDVLGSYSHIEKEIELTLRDGSKRDLYEVMTNVLNTWYLLLYNLGILREINFIDVNRTNLVTRDKAHKAPKGGVLTQYTPIYSEYRNQRYDYLTQKAEPLGKDAPQIFAMWTKMDKFGRVTSYAKANTPVEVKLIKQKE